MRHRPRSTHRGRHANATAQTPTPPTQTRRHPHRISEQDAATGNLHDIHPRTVERTAPMPRKVWGGRDALAAKSAGWEAAAAGVETACDADPG